MTGAKQDATNPFFKSKYADLASVWEACRKPLTDNGLSVAQICDTMEGQSVIETTLMHISGEWISGKHLIGSVKQDPQSVGSASTYSRRYALAAMVGICPEDDDAESTIDRKKKPESKLKAVEKSADQRTIAKPNDPITDPQMRNLNALLSFMKITDDLERHEHVSRILGIEETITSFKALTKGQANIAIDAMQKEKDA